MGGVGTYDRETQLFLSRERSELIDASSMKPAVLGGIVRNHSPPRISPHCYGSVGRHEIRSAVKASERPVPTPEKGPPKKISLDICISQISVGIFLGRSGNGHR